MITKVEKNLSFLNDLNKIPLASDSVRFLKSAESFKSTLLTQIKNAKKRIYLAALYLEDDSAGAEVLIALYDAKRLNPSLDIFVCIDFHRAQRGRIGEKKGGKTNATWYQGIEKAEQLGVKIVGVPVKRKELFGVQHLKGFIFDDLIFYSGASFNDIYLQQEDRYRLDRYWLIENQSLANSLH
jgi:CDP-diacylglycerol--serine O-phosphatidyltransferase